MASNYEEAHDFLILTKKNHSLAYFGEVTPPLTTAIFVMSSPQSDLRARPVATGDGDSPGAIRMRENFLRDAVVMMVDDDELALELIAVYLEEAGCKKFVGTADSTLALRMMAEVVPDILLLDLMMPRVTGMDILTELYRHTELARIPVVVLTASTEVEIKLQALKLGTRDFLAKPVDPSELILRLENILAVKAYQDWLTVERENSDRLLRNILPQPIAERLKRGEKKIADRFDATTVLFADLVSFTELAATYDAEHLVDMLNDIFNAFDDLLVKRGLEKIKTIGDAYMGVAGVPLPRADHADAMVDTALDMLAIADEKDFPFQLRIGINTGPLIAGVIGKSKFSYDLWGDTVNVASRMESQGLPGHIQITQSTKELLSDGFRLERRTPVQDIKGKGPMPTWFVIGRNRDRESSLAKTEYDIGPPVATQNKGLYNS